MEKYINTNEFNELMKKDKPTLVYFGAPWCSYCRRIDGIYQQIAKQYNDLVEVVKINIDFDEELANSQGIEVVPTLIFYNKGKEIKSLVVPESKMMIDQFLRSAFLEIGGCHYA